MKNYSSNRAQKGKAAYRTPSRFIYQKYLAAQATNKQKSKQCDKNYGIKRI